MQALDAVRSVPLAQRLVALIVLDDQADLVTPVARWVRGKPLRLVSLAGDPSPSDDASTAIDAEFKARLPSDPQGAST